MENATNAVLNATNATGDVADANSLMFVYVTLLLTAPTLVYYGSKRSLETEEKETMTTKDAMMFPVVGSCVLFGLFLVFKFFAKEYINMLLHVYFIFLGAVCIATTVHPWLVSLFGEDTKVKVFSFKLKIPFYHAADDEPMPVEATKTEAAAYVVGLAGAAWYGITKHWLSNNLIGACFCIQGIEVMSLGSVLNGVILLIGLFFYDIFWVFGTNWFMGDGNSVMVSVAKNFEAPIKLLFPKTLPSVAGQFSMLGLGDIVIPGFFVAMTLRYDVRVGKGATSVFKWCFGGYCLGLGTTVFVMHVFKAAQPALLYIVPGILLTSFAGAAASGHLTSFSKYVEEEEPKKEEKSEEEVKKEQ
eukprot:TRINITY_DN7845_c0_g1_i1.p1 TRINITY_DN7845_c0_g1~~TRINITY_DN7845_c0_g1_i1.p1  ORF type:complete len:358 (+),score=112.08 TRINITY_DN7845_c0_g1_i1:167-1240(+)